MFTKSNPFDRKVTDIPLIRFAVHSASLVDEICIKNSAAERLVKSNCLQEIEILPLPISNADICQFYLNNELASTQYCQTEAGLILKASDGSQYGVILGSEPKQWSPVSSNSLITFADIQSAKYSDYLVVGKNDPILLSNTLNKNIVTADKALELIRILLTNHGYYYIDTRNHKSNEGLYYLYRFKKLFKSFQYAWSVAVYAHGRCLPEAVFDYLDSLSRRLDFICRAYDKVCFFSLKTADNDTQDNQLYHLGYYVMLATGVFDSLAHIITDFYQLTFKSIFDINLRIKTNKITTEFFIKLSSVNNDLYEYLTKSEVQNQINIFYPLRDALQHRELLKGIRYSDGSQFDRNLFQLTDAAVDSLLLVKPAASCIVGLHKPLMDPIVFISWAQMALTDLVNNILSFMDWESIISSLPADVSANIRQSDALFTQNIGKFLRLTGDDEPLYF